MREPALSCCSRRIPRRRSGRGGREAFLPTYGRISARSGRFCGVSACSVAYSPVPRRFAQFHGVWRVSAAAAPILGPLLPCWDGYSFPGTDIPDPGRIFLSWDGYSRPGTDIPILRPIFPSWDGYSDPGTGSDFLAWEVTSWSRRSLSAADGAVPSRRGGCGARFGAAGVHCPRFWRRAHIRDGGESDCRGFNLRWISGAAISHLFDLRVVPGQVRRRSS